MSRRVSIVLSFWVFVSWAPVASAETGVCPNAFAELESPLSQIRSHINRTYNASVRTTSGSMVNQIKIRDGKGFVKFGMSNDDQSEFKKLVLNAVKAGVVSEINIRDVDDPRDVLYLLQLVAETPKGTSIRITGHMSPAGLIYENEKTQGMVPGLSDALTQLKVHEACLTVWKKTDIRTCELMRFELHTSRLEQIKWKWRSFRGT